MEDDSHKCWKCKDEGELVPHPLAKSKKHPVPWCSSLCNKCGHAVIECDDCSGTWPDSWYELSDIDEGWHYSRGGGYSKCQDCYWDAVDNHDMECEYEDDEPCDCAEVVLCYACDKRWCKQHDDSDGWNMCGLCKRGHCGRVSNEVCGRLIARDSSCWRCREDVGIAEEL